jgi:Kef-type K+ transport system membrane component KefB
VVLLAGIAGVTAVLSLLGGLLGGGSVERAVAVGFYLVGSFMLIAGFFIGNRGPMIFGSRIMRWATPLEREENLNESALFVALGFVLIVIGVAVDSRTGLF